MPSFATSALYFAIASAFSRRHFSRRVAAAASSNVLRCEESERAGLLERFREAMTCQCYVRHIAKTWLRPRLSPC